MSEKLKCYFAHSYELKDSSTKYKIKKILETRNLEVIDPFKGEFRILRKYNIKELDYYNIDYKAGREMWTKDLAQIRGSDLFVGLLKEKSTGVAAELMYALEYQKRIRLSDNTKPFRERRPYLIQIISPVRHPLIAYALQYGNQHFETIKDFENLKAMRW